MASCKHSQWLNIRNKEGNIIVQQTDRLQRLVENFQQPDSDGLSLLCLIGTKKNSPVLRELLSPEYEYKNRRGECGGDIHLHLSGSNPIDGRSVLYAESRLYTNGIRTRPFPTSRCHDVVSRQLQQCHVRTSSQGSIDTADFLYVRLFRPFSDVFCFFCADLGGVKATTRRLGQWLENYELPTSPRAVNPHLMLVFENEVPGLRVERRFKREAFRLLRTHTSKNILEYFCHVEVVSILPEDRSSTERRYNRLSERLIEASDCVRKRRVDARMLFSATHFAVLFRHACDQLITDVNQPFNFVKMSRFRNPVSPETEKHLSRFLRHVKSEAQLVEFAIPIIASSFFLNAYPPEMHVFDPRDVFRSLYMDFCRQVGRAKSSGSILLPTGFIKLVEDQFCRWFESFDRGRRTTSADIHLRNLQSFMLLWRTIRDNEICLVCLQGKAEYFMPCKHGLCETCVQRYGNVNEYHPWVFELDGCPLCRSAFPQVTVKTMDPSRGLRVLSLDGGGCRGIIHPTLLKALEDQIGLPRPVQEWFDVTIGTSSGALVILAMFKAGLSAEECVQVFKKLAKTAFQPRWVLGLPFICDLRRFVISYLADGMYPAEGLETALKQVFGETMTLSDCSYATTIGAKIAVPVTTVRDGAPCLFRSYKGQGNQGRENGYHIIRPQDGYDEPLVWQVARCATAAPGYFTPNSITGIGAYQDGGMWKNNPVSLVHPEVEIIAPMTDEPLIVSVGTGATEDRNIPDTSASRGIWRDGIIPRLYRGLMQFMAGWRQGEDFSNQIDDENYFRFNVDFGNAEPRLDQVNQMAEMAERAQTQFSASEDIPVLGRRFRASEFHFELESMPTERCGTISGVGRILCNMKCSHPAYRRLMEQLLEDSARFYVNGSLVSGKTGDRSFVDVGGNFSKRIEFQTNDGNLSILLQAKAFQPQHISGSPLLVKKRAEAQHLDAYFGQANHQKRKRAEIGKLPPRKRRSTGIMKTVPTVL